MSDDIVKKLREKPWRGGGESHNEAQIRRQKEREDGADLIEAQRKRIAELKAALNKINDKDSYPNGGFGPFAEIARTALTGGES